MGKCYFCNGVVEKTEDVTYIEGQPCCPECFTRIDLESRLENDPEIAPLNDKYAKYGFWRYLSGIICIVSMILTIMSVSGEWSAAIGIPCLFAVPFSGIAFIAFSIMRRIYRKKLFEIIRR